MRRLSGARNLFQSADPLVIAVSKSVHWKITRRLRPNATTGIPDRFCQTALGFRHALVLGEGEMKATFHTAILVICVAIGAPAQGPDGRAGATGSETSGQSWPSNTVATEPFTGLIS